MAEQTKRRVVRTSKKSLDELLIGGEHAPKGKETPLSLKQKENRSWLSKNEKHWEGAGGSMQMGFFFSFGLGALITTY